MKSERKIDMEGVSMKDYSLNLEDSKIFVLNYTVKDNQITVHFANGKNYVIPYTTANEVKLLKKMKTQVLQSDEFMNQQKKRLSISRIWIIFSVGLLVPNVILLANGTSVVPIINGLSVILLTFDIGYRIYSIIDSKRNIKDINKNKMLLKNEEKLNEKITENHNILANTNEKIKAMAHSTPESQPVFTLNSIDKIKYEELQQILENIDREEEFDFDYFRESEEKPLVLKKK